MVLGKSSLYAIPAHRSRFYFKLINALPHRMVCHTIVEWKTENECSARIKEKRRFFIELIISITDFSEI